VQDWRAMYSSGRREPAGAEPPISAPSVSEWGAAEADAECVQDQLERIVRSRAFDATDRMRAFLAYVVGEKLAGRERRIKAYTIATDIFGRDASFDSHTDAIVRIEAGHLRRALERYYLTVGIADPIVITVPKGSYVPTFEIRRPSPQPAPKKLPAPFRWIVMSGVAALVLLGVTVWTYMGRERRTPPSTPALPGVVVEAFEDLSNAGNSKAIAQGLTQEILGQIAKFKDIVAIGESRFLREADAPPTRYILSGSVTIEDNRVRIQARVLNRAQGRVIWANNYESDLRASKVLEFEVDIARQVATALGQPYGVIYQADLSQTDNDRPEDWAAYACTLSYYAYRVRLDAKSHPVIRKCLEGAVARFPSYATAWALLSQTYMDEIRFHYSPDPSSSPASIDRALAAARQAVELDPDNVRALQAEMLALWFSGQHKAALAVGERAIALNPNDTELAGEYGFRAAAAGQWSQGCSFLKQARDRNPGPLGYFEIALAICAYFREDYAEAALWIRKTPLPDNHNYHLIAAVIYAELGLAEDLKRERDWLMERSPSIIANIRQELAARYLRAEDRQRLIQSLIKAGLPVPPEAKDR
jgi:TolB-like protein